MSNLSLNELKNILTQCGISYEDKISNEWLSCKCPAHVDENFGNASININSLIFSCFSCNTAIHLQKVIQERLNLSYKEALKLLNQNTENHDYLLTKRISKKPIQTKKEEPKKIYYNNSKQLEFTPENYLYTKVRGYTKEYCNQFKIKNVTEGYYKDYFSILIIDSEKGINEYEYRRLKEYETLKEFFKIRGNLPLEVLKNRFKELTFIPNNNLTFYLKRPKTLYPKGSRQKETIYNIDNLDYNEDIILSEGVASHPKLYQYISKNSSCLFGVQYSDSQINILKRFKKKIIILSDNDSASLNMIYDLSQIFENLYVFNVKTDDKEEDFVDKIKSAEIIKASKFLIKAYNII